MTTMMSLQQLQPSPRRSNLNPSAREWFPPGYLSKQTDSARAQPELDQAANEEFNPDAVFMLSELPLEILSSVVGFLGSPQDLFSCILTNHQLRAAVRSGGMSLQLSGRPRQLLSFPRQAGQLDDLVQSLTTHMPAMSACDLSMLPLEHKHVSQLAQGLHLLQHLDMSGCKKLQPSMTKRLLQGLASKQLQSLNLQRCFQLTDQCLTDVLEYACGSHSSSKALQCIALSHLNLAAWPAAAAADASADSNNDDNNSSSGSSSTVSGSDESGDACAASVMNNFAADAAGSTAAQWGDVAGALLYKLPKQLGAPLLSTGSTAALRMVVLSNCNMLTVSGLVSLAVACPQLEYLFLGGSTLKSPEVLAAGAAGLPAAGVYVPRSVAAAAAAAGDDRVRLGSASELPGALQQLSELLQLPRTLPWEVLSSCCDTDNCSSGCGHCICCCTCCSSARSRAQQRGDSGREASDAEQRARKRLHRNEPSAAAVAAARGHALSLTYVAALLPGLKALEVTFMAPGLAGWLRVCLDRLAHLGQHHQQQHMSSPNSLRLRSSMGLSGVLERTDSGSSSSSSRSDTFGAGASSSRSMLAAGSLLAAGSPRPKVWQFSCATAVADALQTLSAVRRAHRAADSGSNGSDADSSASTMLSPDCLAMAVKCAVNCSSRGRSTPLHMAADAGCACHIRALVAAGAAVAARDASGASALFVACESGQAAAASVLLGAGADALVGNTAGETPLYIAALRGHLSVVELLLGHLSAADVDWTQRQLYGDAWTPLMAAAVANRVSVALCLLRAAARLCCSSKPSPICSSKSYSTRQPQQLGSPGITRLLAAENRYGQTVLHIAARKGCMELLQLLLVYGAGQVAGRAVDAAGDTPLDIARRHGHDMVVRELLQQC